jgi:hypothetical protein
MAVGPSPDEDQQLGPTIDDRLHRVRGPTIPDGLHPPIELTSCRPDGRLHLDRRIHFSAVCLCTLPQVGVAEIHI